jgi:hypothetical protein
MSAVVRDKTPLYGKAHSPLTRRNHEMMQQPSSAGASCLSGIGLYRSRDRRQLAFGPLSCRDPSVVGPVLNRSRSQMRAPSGAPRAGSGFGGRRNVRCTGEYESRTSFQLAELRRFRSICFGSGRCDYRRVSACQERGACGPCDWLGSGSRGSGPCAVSRRTTWSTSSMAAEILSLMAKCRHCSLPTKYGCYRDTCVSRQNKSRRLG